MATVAISSGLAQVNNEPRYHYDIYAILEAPQELYFGHETQVNVNVVETVRVPTDDGTIEKCYISPTKRRGVERRSLIWAPVQSDGVLLGDKLGCGIPHTCTQIECPICAVYGGLIPSATDVEVMGKKSKRQPATTIGRLVHGGGVAIQELEPSEKQRAMHPSMLHKDPGADPTPTPFKREYNEPALLYPVYNHCMSITESEFQAVAYAYIDSHARLGAGNPKGVKIYETEWLNALQPLLVVDRYLAPLGKRPVLSPQISKIQQAVDAFCGAATSVRNKLTTEAYTKIEQDGTTLFERWIGNAALTELQNDSVNFALAYLK